MPAHLNPHLMARRLARWVCCWWLLALSVAMASPVVFPQAMEWVCSSAGVVKLVQKVDDTGPRLSHHTLDCPLCMATGAPPPSAAVVQAQTPQPLRHVLYAHVQAPWTPRVAAPLPARGPPRV